MRSKIVNLAKLVSLATAVQIPLERAALQQTPPTELGAFQIKINTASMLPELQVKVTNGPNEKQSMLMSLNATYTVFWADNCTQSLLGAPAPCNSTPTFVNDFFTEAMYFANSPNTTYTAQTAIDGYTFTGQQIYASVTIVDGFAADGTPSGTSPLIEPLGAMNVQQINSDAWLSNVNQNTVGSFGLGYGADLWWNVTYKLIDPAVNSTAFQIYIGPVNDWSIFNGSVAPAPQNSSINFGAPGAAPSTFWNISTDSSQQFRFSSISFGQNLTNNFPSSTTFFYPILSDPEEILFKMTLALDYQGLGLPSNAFEMFSEMLQMSPLLTGQVLPGTCAAGMCQLVSTCDTYSIELQTLQFLFNVSTTGNSQPLLTIPLANFANTSGSVCQIYVQPTPLGYADSLVVLGTMVVQSLDLSYIYNYTTGIPTVEGAYYSSGVNIVASVASVILANTQMEWDLSLEGANPFWQNQSLLLNPIKPAKELLMPYIQADFLSTNPTGIYLLDLASSEWLTFGQSCYFMMSQTNQNQTCLDQPINVNADNQGTSTLLDVNHLIAGYAGSGSLILNDQFTIFVQNPLETKPVTVEVTSMVGTNLTGDYWLQSNPVRIDGVVGLGSQSGIWFSSGSTPAFPNLPQNQAQLAVGLSNMTDWTAFSPTGLPNTAIITGGFGLNFSDIIQLGTPHTMSSVYVNTTSNTLYLALQSLGFGINYQNGSAFYQTLLVNASTAYNAILALDFRGLGLDQDSYIAFADMLYQVTNSSFDCGIQTPSNNLNVFQPMGSCIAAQPCSAFPELWNYSLNVTFNESNGGNGNYLIVPLATFAQTFINEASYGTQGAEYCEIHVELTQLYPQNVVLGAMFFQQFFALFTTGYGSTQLQQVRFYANNQFVLPGLYLGSAAVSAVAANPFVVTPQTPQVTTTSGPGIVPTPAFNLGVGSSAPAADYLIDFSSPNLYVWDVSCTYNTSSCSDSPVFGISQYSTTNTLVGTFSKLWTAGYEVSGNIYIDSVMNTNSVNQRLVRVYAVTLISQVTWMIGSNTNSAGVLGLSGTSPFMSQFITNQSTNGTLEYSVVVNQTPLTSEANQIIGSATVVTLGPGDQSAYAAQPSLVVDASQYNTEQASNFVYTLLPTNSTPAGYGLGFGVLNSTNSSWYYENLLIDGNQAASVFSTSFSGLGLTPKDFLTFSTLLFNATNGIFNCTNTSCSNPNSCLVNRQNLTALSFQVRFALNPTNYLIIPLETLAITNITTGACELLIIAPPGSNNDYTIFGSQFFTNFFGSFVTTNATSAAPTQAMTLYLVPNLLNQATISSVEYPLGENPFYTEVTPTPPSPGPNPPAPTSSKLETIFIIIFVIIVLIVLGAVIYTCHNKYKKKQQTEAAAAFVYANKESVNTESQKELLA